MISVRAANRLRCTGKNTELYRPLRMDQPHKSIEWRLLHGDAGCNEDLPAITPQQAGIVARRWLRDGRYDLFEQALVALSRPRGREQ